MKLNDLPIILSRRFDVEELGQPMEQLTQHADQGPVYICKDGRVSYVVLTEEIFEQIWPDTQRAFSVIELPKRLGDLLDRGLENTLTDRSE
jgi:hypothetical protein